MNERLDITKVVNEYLCHSCGACHVACPKDCISSRFYRSCEKKIKKGTRDVDSIVF